MSHILIAYKQFPAPAVGHAGGESLFTLMEALHRRGHRLSLVARITEAEREQVPAVEAICEHLTLVPHHSDVAGPRPLVWLESYRRLRRATAQAVARWQPDFLHVETTQTAGALLGLRLPPGSYRTQDVNWFLAEQRLARAHGRGRLRPWLSRAFFRRFEPLLCRHYALTLAISEGDRRLLSAVCDPERLLLVPLVPALDAVAPVEPAVPPGPNLLFVGAMSRDHNLAGVTWFLDEIWPRIVAQLPEARFFIVGGQPPETLQARAVQEREAGRQVVVTGFVPELAPWYRAAAVFVSPLLVAGGLLQKVVDALAMGVPVVATPVCNHGVGATPGEHLLTEATPAAFADAVLRLLRDARARERVGAAGRHFIEMHYQLGPAVDRWEAALLALQKRGTSLRS